MWCSSHSSTDCSISSYNQAIYSVTYFIANLCNCYFLGLQVFILHCWGAIAQKLQLLSTTWQSLCAVLETHIKRKNCSSKQVRKFHSVISPQQYLTRFFFSFTAVIARLSTFGDDQILTKCATQNLEYVINKKKSIASTEKKGKGKKIVEVKILNW